MSKLVRIILITGLCAVLLLGAYYLTLKNQVVGEEQSQSYSTPDILSMVTATAEINTDECSGTDEVLVSISNNSQETVLSSWMVMRIFRRGYTGIVGGSEDIYSNKIIEPDDTFSLCKSYSVFNTDENKTLQLDELIFVIDTNDVRTSSGSYSRYK